MYCDPKNASHYIILDSGICRELRFSRDRERERERDRQTERERDCGNELIACLTG
jgi:hypothetical protein